MRSSGTCPRCARGEIGHLVEVLEYLHECEDIYQPPRKSPEQWTASTIACEEHNDAPRGEPREKLVGQIEAYVCTSCGYLEPYLRDYREIQWERVRHVSLAGAAREVCARCACGDLVTIEQLGEHGGRRRLMPLARKVVWRLTITTLVGEIQATVCQGCGYLEQHLRDPDRLPWESVVGLSWLSATGCARCDGERVARLEGVGPPDARLAMTQARARRGGEWGVHWDGGPAPRDAGYVGRLGAEVCAGCGHVTLLVRDPASVPWGELFGFSML